MRALIISIVLLLLITGVSVLNSIYINTLTDLLTDALLMTPIPQTGDNLTGNEADYFMTLWLKHKLYIALTVNSEYIYEVDEYLRSMITYSINKELNEFATSREILLLNIRRIKNIECFSIFNII